MTDPASSAQVPRVLVVDDEESQRSGLASMLCSWGYAAETAADGMDALGKLRSGTYSAVVTDLMMPVMDGYTLLKYMAEEGTQVPTIVLTAFGNVETAINTVHDLGAFWFLEKPIQPAALRVLLERASAVSRLTDETERLQRSLFSRGVLVEMVGQSEPMLKVFSLARQVAPTRSAVLITGESGTGKELLARAIHHLSQRRSGPFLPVNCAALPETLIESELLGHEKGAFPGAVERRAGCFELAQHGTLLLDEIGEMPISTQAKLLRVLEDMRVRRLGGKTEIVVDVRVIAATNRGVDDALCKGQLREDLFYRLNVFGIHLPPLRDREGDLPLLTEQIIRELNHKHGLKLTGVDDEVMARFHHHQWPGNVRELRNVLERAAIIAGEGSIGIQHLSGSLNPARSCVLSVPGHLVIPEGITADEAERALIVSTLRLTKNNKTRAAEILGISLKTLFNKLKEYGSREEQSIHGEPIDRPNWPQVFVLMPFDRKLMPVYTNHIRKVAQGLQLTCERADDFVGNGSVVQEIWSAICHASVVVADCTGRNPNVFYEIGMAHALGKETILITQSEDDIPFDLAHLRYIAYEYTPDGIQRFEETLSRTLVAVLAQTAYSDLPGEMSLHRPL